MTSPATLGRHTLLRRLAAGGMGEVYLAEVQGAAGFSRRVAIKRILPHLARDEDFVRKFIDEANIMVQLHHGNIVGVQELADHDGELYIVMDYLPGRDLKAVIHRLRQRRMTMPPELALWLTTEICAALDYAHRMIGPDGQPLHIVHRDVSPSNIVLGAAGEVKLLDFGIARARGRLHQSVSGTLQGKFVYMSPEQADGRPVDPRSDVFSAGLVLYELLTGNRPLEGESETETLRLVRQARIPPPSSLASLDPAVDALVLGALAVEPDARYASAAEMRRALLMYLADTRSLVDARTLAEFLATLFPEGVVPSDAPDPPLSFDDALQLQLGALTPSIDPMTRTRTGEPQGPTPTPRPERTPTPLPATQAVVLPPVSPPGLKRVLTLGVVVGALLASGVTLWWARRGEASLAPQVEGPAEYEVRVNGGAVAAGARFPVGEPLRICVQAEDYVEACRSLPLARGENRPVFKLSPVPVLVLDVEPGGAVVQATASGLPVDRQPYPLQPGKSYRVCLASWPDGLDPEARCQTIERAEQGTYRLAFRLVPSAPRPAPDAAVVDAAPPDAGVAPPDAAPEPVPRRPARPRATEQRLSSQPAAVVRCDDGTIGNTPLVITARTEPVRCELNAEGHVPLVHVVKPGLGRTDAQVALQLPAFLSARAWPGAARLLIDGKPLPDSFVARLPIPPGRHRLEAVIERDGRTWRKTETIEARAGQELSVEVRIADYPAEGAAP